VTNGAVSSTSLRANFHEYLVPWVSDYGGSNFWSLIRENHYNFFAFAANNIETLFPATPRLMRIDRNAYVTLYRLIGLCHL
jgi:hypothetical protein